VDAPNIVVRREFIGLLGLLAIAIGIKQILNREEESTEIQAVNTDFAELLDPNPIFAVVLSIVHPNTYKVAAMTVANGGDNISIYISIYITLFAGQDFASLGIIFAVFLGMVGVCCGIAYLLSR
jgi:cadmium resistance protein CadD (predicted permease)